MINEYFTMQRNSNGNSTGGSKIVLDIPARDTSLFGSQAVHDVLAFL